MVQAQEGEGGMQSWWQRGYLVAKVGRGTTVYMVGRLGGGEELGAGAAEALGVQVSAGPRPTTKGGKKGDHAINAKTFDLFILLVLFLTD